jgi:hypothetical protein
MSEVRRKPKSGSSATASNPTRPMWYLGPGAMPIAAASKKVPKGATAFCCEEDDEWTPIDQVRPSDVSGAIPN